MTRYWIKFAPHGPSPLTLGCGVTALDWEDAKGLVSQLAFEGGSLPEIIQVIENVDVSTLDAGHVILTARDLVPDGVPMRTLARS